MTIINRDGDDGGDANDDDDDADDNDDDDDGDNGKGDNDAVPLATMTMMMAMITTNYCTWKRLLLLQKSICQQCRLKKLI